MMGKKWKVEFESAELIGNNYIEGILTDFFINGFEARPNCKKETELRNKIKIFCVDKHEN